MPASQMPRPRAGDLVAHRVHRGRDLACRGRSTSSPRSVGRDAALVDVELLRLRLAEAERALDMGEIAAELRMHLADDDVAALHRPRGRHAERMRIGMAIAGPQEQRRLLAAVGEHRLHHAGVDLAFLDAGPRGVAAGRQHQVAEPRRLARAPRAPRRS